MTNTVKILLIVGGIILVIGLLIGGSYNTMVKLDEEVSGQYANIETTLQRRTDLIPNLVNAVKGYASHEEDLFTDLAEAKAKMMGASSVDELEKANNEVTASLGRLFALSEAYPELKANQNFIQLQDELAGTENRIAVARKDYNNVVKKYNATIKTFPKVILAGMFGFDEKDYFEASSNADKVPDVNFE